MVIITLTSNALDQSKSKIDDDKLIDAVSRNRAGKDDFGIRRLDLSNLDEHKIMSDLTCYTEGVVNFGFDDRSALFFGHSICIEKYSLSNIRSRKEYKHIRKINKCINIREKVIFKELKRLCQSHGANTLLIESCLNRKCRRRIKKAFKSYNINVIFVNIHSNFVNRIPNYLGFHYVSPSICNLHGYLDGGTKVKDFADVIEICTK